MQHQRFHWCFKSPGLETGAKHIVSGCIPLPQAARSDGLDRQFASTRVLVGETKMKEGEASHNRQQVGKNVVSTQSARRAPSVVLIDDVVALEDRSRLLARQLGNRSDTPGA